MQNFFKIYPKSMTVEMVGEQLLVQLTYSVEQYGMLTGPFSINVSFHPEILDQGIDPWVIISNTSKRYNNLFDRFFCCMERYLKEFHGINPFEEVRSGIKKHFEMHFPEIHYDHDERSFTNNDMMPPTLSGRAKTLVRSIF
jgi:hypothetical protein